MPKKRTGVNPLAYTGVRALTPPNIIFEDRAPKPTDYIGHVLGDWWVYARDRNTTPIESPRREDIWILVSKDQRLAKQLYPNINKPKAVWINMAGEAQRSAFSAYLSANQNNIPADGSTYIIPFDSTYNNVGDDFDTTTGRYIAPADGTYNFSAGITADNITAAMTSGYIQFFVEDSGGTVITIWTIIRGNPANMRDTTVSNRWRTNGTVTIPLNAGERVGVSIVVRTDNDNDYRIFTRGGTNRNRTWFTGFRVF